MEFDERERVYGRDEYYWGTEPNAMAEETADIVSDRAGTPTAVDLGARGGSRRGVLRRTGVERVRRRRVVDGPGEGRTLADRRSVTLRTIRADANDFVPGGEPHQHAAEVLFVRNPNRAAASGPRGGGRLALSTGILYRHM